MRLVSVLVPCYNEEEMINEFYNRIYNVIDKLEYNFELLFVNDGSTDKTLELIRKLVEKDKRVKYIDLSRNFGKEIAMAAGFDYVTGEATIIIDADLQDPPELIPTMILEWENGYDDVYARRISRVGETKIKKLTSYLFYRILSRVSKVPIQKDTGDFRLLSKKAVKAIQKFRENQRYTKGLFSLIGFHKKEVLYEREARKAGKTKWNYFKLIDLAIEGITSFTTLPLKLATVLGILVSLSSFLYIIKVVIKALIYRNDPPGYPSLISIILFLGGIQLLALGIIGEYLGRIFNESKNRPLYFINEYSGGEK